MYLIFLTGELEIRQLSPGESDRISQEDVDDNILGPNQGYPYETEIYVRKQSNKIYVLGTMVVNNLPTVVANPLQVEICLMNLLLLLISCEGSPSTDIKLIRTIRGHCI
ncbi:hypothetical protein NPIL_16751 [Nephila pilipes]|uniref:Uncharacterized protein n=1 Tax=Nephila pilipes TaxID=299642 RepID=A0A8X6TGC4_NEPPI|nr:hypothetical protein NPIL_16751 [Nephila pilipes]